MAKERALIEVDNLTVDYRRNGAWHEVIRDLSLSIAAGEIQGLVGESGCGKSTLASLLLGERRTERRVRAGSIRFAGTDLVTANLGTVRSLRGARIALVPQNGGTSLTPTRRIGKLFAETFAANLPGLTRQERAERAAAALSSVGLPQSETLLQRFPHQFSGGQQQRIALALALSCEPELIVLDEPTTGQDAVTRRSIVDLLIGLRRSREVTMLYVSHDLATLGEVCSRIAVMYAGEIVENGPAAAVLNAPVHPYAQALMASQPSLEVPPDPTAILRGSLDRAAAPDGCRFAPRCRLAEVACLQERQRLCDIAPAHSAACWRIGEAGVIALPAAEERAARRVFA